MMAAGTTYENIIVKLQLMSSKFANNMRQNGNAIKQFGNQISDVGTSIGQSTGGMKRMNNVGARLPTVMGKAMQSLRMFTHGLRGFRMEMLGVMFFGMMLQQMFLGFLRPVMEAFGVFDLFRVMLLVLFLPVMELLFPYLLQLMEYFMELPEDTKKWIGVLVLLGIVLGTFLYVLGTFSLGIGSVILAFKFMGPVLIKLGIAIGGISASMLLLFGIAIIIAYGIYKAWTEDFLGMRSVLEFTWNGIKTAFSGAFDFIIGVFDLFLALFNGDLDGVLEALGKMKDGLDRLKDGIIDIFIGIMVTVLIGLLRFAWGVVQVLWELGTRIYRWVIDTFSEMGIDLEAWGKVIINSLIRGIDSMTGGLLSGFNLLGVDVIKEFIKGITSMGSYVLNAILNLFPDSISDVIRNMFGGVTRPISPPSITYGQSHAPNTSTWDPALNTTNVTNNFYGFTKEDLTKELDDRDRALVSETERLIRQ